MKIISSSQIKSQINMKNSLIISKILLKNFKIKFQMYKIYLSMFLKKKRSFPKNTIILKKNFNFKNKVLMKFMNNINLFLKHQFLVLIVPQMTGIINYFKLKKKLIKIFHLLKKILKTLQAKIYHQKQSKLLSIARLDIWKKQSKI